MPKDPVTNEEISAILSDDLFRIMFKNFDDRFITEQHIVDMRRDFSRLGLKQVANKVLNLPWYGSFSVIVLLLSFFIRFTGWKNSKIDSLKSTWNTRKTGISVVLTLYYRYFREVKDPPREYTQES